MKKLTDFVKNWFAVATKKFKNVMGIVAECTMLFAGGGAVLAVIAVVYGIIIAFVVSVAYLTLKFLGAF